MRNLLCQNGSQIGQWVRFNISANFASFFAFFALRTSYNTKETKDFTKTQRPKMRLTTSSWFQLTRHRKFSKLQINDKLCYPFLSHIWAICWNFRVRYCFLLPFADRTSLPDSVNLQGSCHDFAGFGTSKTREKLYCC